MKKKLLVAIISVITLSANAQITKGQKLVGPNLGFGINNYKEIQKNTATDVTKKSFNVSANLGYSILKMKTNKKANGWRLGYLTSYLKNDYEYITNTNTDKTFNHSFLIGYVNRNFVPIKSKLNFYYELVYAAQAGFGKIKYTTTNTTNVTTYNTNNQSISAFIIPGFTYQLKNNLLIEAALNNIGSIGVYRNYSKQSDTSPSSNYENSQINFSANSSLSANNLLNNFTFSLKWILNK